MSPLAYLRIGAAVLALAILTAAAGWFVHHERDVGRAQVQAKWDAERVALQTEVQTQKDKNIGLQHAAELHYTVQAQTRDRVITKIVTEVRDATKDLAACPVPEPARELLNDAGRCASTDSAAACGAGDPVQPPV